MVVKLARYKVEIKGEQKKGNQINFNAKIGLMCAGPCADLTSLFFPEHRKTDLRLKRKKMPNSLASRALLLLLRNGQLKDADFAKLCLTPSPFPEAAERTSFFPGDSIVLFLFAFLSALNVQQVFVRTATWTCNSWEGLFYG
jgi:hypothetical protein